MVTCESGVEDTYANIITFSVGVVDDLIVDDDLEWSAVLEGEEKKPVPRFHILNRRRSKNLLIFLKRSCFFQIFILLHLLCFVSVCWE